MYSGITGIVWLVKWLLQQQIQWRCLYILPLLECVLSDLSSDCCNNRSSDSAYDSGITGMCIVWLFKWLLQQQIQWRCLCIVALLKFVLSDLSSDCCNNRSSDSAYDSIYIPKEQHIWPFFSFCCWSFSFCLASFFFFFLGGGRERLERQ